MKVLMFGWEFPPFNSGGLGTACLGLTKSLSKCGVDLTFVLPKKVDLNVDFLKMVYGDDFKNGKFKGYFFNSLLHGYTTEDSYEEEFKVEKKNKDIYGKNLMEEVLRYGIVAAEIAGSEEFDVIHAHDWLTYSAGVAAKKVSGKKLVVHVHATEFDRGGENGINKQVYEIEREGMQKADLVVTVSDLTKKRVIESYGVDPKKVITVHNAVEFEDYVGDYVSELKRDKKIVLFLGRLTFQKGPEYFVHAAKKALEFYPDVMFVVAGSGDMERQMIRMVAEMGLSDKFIFAGFLRGKAIHEAYRMADLYIMPSVSEPFGITPLESLMNGTPVLISKQSGVSEVLNNCLKTDFWDTDDMANKIVSVLKHKELHKELRENGRKEVKKFSWDEPARRCVDIYRRVLEERKGDD